MQINSVRHTRKLRSSCQTRQCWSDITQDSALPISSLATYFSALFHSKIGSFKNLATMLVQNMKLRPTGTASIQQTCPCHVDLFSTQIFPSISISYAGKTCYLRTSNQEDMKKNVPERCSVRIRHETRIIGSISNQQTCRLSSKQQVKTCCRVHNHHLS